MVPLLPESKDIARRRKALGLRQGELAKLAGVSQSFIAKLELGKINPSYSRMKSILNALDSKETEEKPTAAQVMRRSVIHTSPAEKLSKVIALMRRHSISQLPVTEQQSIVGAITERSIITAMESGKRLSEVPVSSAMEESFPQVSESTPLPSIVQLLKHSDAVLVTKKGRLQGIISKSDVLRA